MSLVSFLSSLKFSFLFTRKRARGAGGGGVEGGGEEAARLFAEDLEIQWRLNGEDFHFLCYAAQIISV